MNVIALERSEAILWTIVSRFESLAAEQYRDHAPELSTAEKAELVELLGTRVHGSGDLSGTTLEAPIAQVLATVTSADRIHILVDQGLFLELVGEAIYRNFAENAATSEATRDLCARGLASSARARALVPDLLRASIGSGDVLLQAIMTESSPLLRSLDALGEAIDATFLDRYGVSFADLMGDVAAELVALCAELEIDRRKFIAFLTGALMGT